MSETWTTKRLLEWTTEHLKKYGIESARLDAEILLAAALGCKRIDLYTNFDAEPPEEKKTIFRDFVKRRSGGEPVAYLVGHKEFYSLDFLVDRNTLIPRPETELLVVEALDLLKNEPTKSGDETRLVCDVGTGSGAIAVALAHSLFVGPQSKQTPRPKSRECRIIAVDISEAALAVARKNAEKNGVADRIDFLHSDLLERVDGPLDLIVSNPPYVSRSEFEKLEPGVRNFEPETALLAGEQGTEVVQRLISQAKEKLKKTGSILIEISPMIADATVALFEPDFWSDVRLVKDLAGLNRIVVATKYCSPHKN